MAQLVLKKLTVLLEERFGVKEALIQPDADLQKDLGLDSLDAVDLLLAVNEAFDIQVSTDNLSSIHTIADLVAEIEKRK